MNKITRLTDYEELRGYIIKQHIIRLYPGLKLPERKTYREPLLSEF